MFKSARFYTLLFSLFFVHQISCSSVEVPYTIVLKVRNETPKNYDVYLGENKLPAGKATSTQLITLPSEWISPLISINENDLNKLTLDLIHHYNYLEVRMGGTANDAQSQNYDLSQGRPSFVVLLKLRGSNLERSEFEIVAHQ